MDYGIWIECLPVVKQSNSQSPKQIPPLWAMPEGCHLLDLPGLVRLSCPHDENQRPGHGEAMPSPSSCREMRFDVHAVAAT